MIGVAIIGLGNALAPHAKALQDLAHRVRVVHAVAGNAGQRRFVAEVYGFPICDDTAAAMADPRVDAVMILTPTNRMETEDYATALVRLGNGAPGSIVATVPLSRAAGSKSW